MAGGGAPARIGRLAVVVVVLVALLAALLAAALGAAAAGSCAKQGGAAPRGRPRSLVVDTLNLAHWLRRKSPPAPVGTCEALAAIEETAPLLRPQFPDQLIYVVKTREARRSPAEAAQTRALYQAAARRAEVRVDLVEHLPDPPAPRPGGHAALGRDDFYALLRAWRLGAGVLSRDRFRDLDAMRGGQLPPFHVYRFTPWGVAPGRDFVTASAAEFRRLRRPPRYEPAALLPDK